MRDARKMCIATVILIGICFVVILLSRYKIHCVLVKDPGPASLVNHISSKDTIKSSSSGKETAIATAPRNNYGKHDSSQSIDLKKLYLVVDIIGGLGNRLWQMATAYGIARMTNRTVYACTPLLKRMSAMFPKLEDHIVLVSKADCRKGSATLPKDIVKKMQYGSSLYYDPALISFIRDSKQHVQICCYLQNLGFIIAHEQEIKELFVLAEVHRAKGQARLHAITAQVAKRLNARQGLNKQGETTLNGTTVTYIALHVRRGDTMRDNDIIKPGRSYFVKAMAIFNQRYSGTRQIIFVVITDDIKWSRENIPGERVFFTTDLPGMGTEWDDDYSTAVECNHTIVSIGTFGWWIAYMSGGDVVYFKDWVANKSRWTSWYLPGQRYPYKWKGLKL